MGQGKSKGGTPHKTRAAERMWVFSPLLGLFAPCGHEHGANSLPNQGLEDKITRQFSGSKTRCVATDHGQNDNPCLQTQAVFWA
jgi:hypothetical protein